MRKTIGAFLMMSAMAFAASSVYDFTLDSLKGEPAPLANYKGKVLLIVNVASQCGYTPQYEGLQALFQKYKDQGLVIAGFPANNFGGQEPGSNAEIGAFCKSKFGVTFPMYSKISVKGADTAPLYKFLTQNGTDIQWNFTKFLVDRHGKVIHRFEPAVEPLSKELESAVAAALAAK